MSKIHNKRENNKMIITNSIKNNNSVYVTTPLRGLADKSLATVNVIKSLLMINKESDIFRKVNNNLIAVIGDNDKIPSFFHPIVFEDKVYIDCRAFISKEGNIRNQYEWSLLVRRGCLDYQWIIDSGLFIGVENFVIDSFSTWFSVGLQRNTNASLLTATNYKIISAIYYLGLFNTDTFSSDEEIINYLLKYLPRIIRIPAQVILDIISVKEELIIDLFTTKQVNLFLTDKTTKINQLAEAITELTNEPFKIDTGIIYNSLCRGAFMAANAAEITSIALEHPATFIAMLTCVINKGLQGNTGLGRAALSTIRFHDKAVFDKFIILHSGITKNDYSN
jgi:hypothetical protein